MRNTNGLASSSMKVLMKRFTSILVEASVDLFLKIVKLVTVERDAHGDAFFRLNDQLVKTLTALPSTRLTVTLIPGLLPIHGELDARASSPC